MKKLLWVLPIVVSLMGCYQMLPIAPQSSPPPFTYRVAWPWEVGTVYVKGDVVTMPVFAPGGPIYESLQDGNVGVEPPTRIGSNLDVWGNEGDQLPWRTPTEGWEKWWKLIALQE